MRGTIIRQAWITRADLRANPGRLYLFGDNLAERGTRGQALEMRGEPNALGIPTKRYPRLLDGAFFSDADYDRVEPLIRSRFRQVREWLAKGGDVVVPADGLGTGLAQLDKRAPRIAALIADEIAALERFAAEDQPGVS